MQQPMTANLPPDLAKLHEAHNEKYQNLLKHSKDREDALTKELQAAQASVNSISNGQEG